MKDTITFIFFIVLLSLLAFHIRARPEDIRKDKIEIIGDH